MMSGRDRPQKDALDTSVPVVVLAPGYLGHSIARSLGRLGVPMYGVHADPRSPAVRSRFWRENFFWDVSTAPAAESVDWLLRLSRTIGSCPILIPTDDSGCLLLADHGEALSEGFLFPNPPAGLARALSNKQQMYSLCKRYSIPTAETLFPRCREEVIAFLANITFPVMLKLIDNSLAPSSDCGKKVIVQDAQTLLKYYDEMETPGVPNLMLQAYIPGGDDAVWMFNGYFDEQSRCLFGLTGKKIRQSPPYTGVASLGVCIANEDVATQTEEFMKAIGYRGILDIGYKYDARDGQYKLLDVNPRIGATFRLFVDTHEMDVARALYRDLTGQPVSSGKAREGRKWVLEPFDLASSFVYWRDGNLPIREWVRSFRGVEEESWFARDDLAPFVKMWWHSLQQAFHRVFGGGTEPEPASSHQQRVDVHFTAAARYWKELYEESSLWGRIHQERHAIVLRWIDELALPPGARILDTGCGAGLLAADLAKRGYIVDAIDPSEAMVELARARATEVGVSDRLAVSTGDAHDLPFPTAAYDLVTAIGVVPFLHLPTVAIAEMARVVKPEGYILLTSDNRFRLTHILDPRFAPVFVPPALDPVKLLVKRALHRANGNQSGSWRTNMYSYASLQRLLCDSGLAVTKCTTLGFGPFSFFQRKLLPEATAMRLHRRLQNLADRNAPVLRSTGAQHIVLAVPAALSQGTAAGHRDRPARVACHDGPVRS